MRSLTFLPLALIPQLLSQPSAGSRLSQILGLPEPALPIRELLERENGTTARKEVGVGRDRRKRSDLSFTTRGRTDVGSILGALGIQLDDVFGGVGLPQAEEISKLDLDFNKTGQGWGAMMGTKQDVMGAVNGFRGFGGGVDGRGNPQGSWSNKWSLAGGALSGFNDGGIKTDLEKGMLKWTNTELLAGIGNVFSSFGITWNPNPPIQ